MRDIRTDLKERLGAIEQERVRIQASVQAQLDELDEQEEGVQALLRHEDRRFASNNGNGNGHAAQNGGTPLSQLILTTLHNSKRALTVDEFKEAAATARFDFGKKAPGRVLHWALVGMAQAEIVEKKSDDKWYLKEAGQ